METDDESVGRLLTRRQAIALGGTSAAAWLAGCSTASDAAGSSDSTSADATTTSPAMSTDDPDYPATGTMTETSVTTSDGTTACVAQPELTEGPYYVDENLRRSDIRSDSSTGERQAGVKLDLDYKVYELTDDSCTPLENAIVDVWHANASGVYSDVEAQNTLGQDFLRGIQLTDETGAASFTTIYPGWYMGRAVHIHFKIRSSEDATDAYEFTSQLFFDDDVTDQVYAQEPYSERGERDTLNSEDNIFLQDSASQLILDVTETGEGYSGTLNVALYTSGETAEEDSAAMGGGGNAPPDEGGPPNGSAPPNGDAPPNQTAPVRTNETTDAE